MVFGGSQKSTFCATWKSTPARVAVVWHFFGILLLHIFQNFNETKFSVFVFWPKSQTVMGWAVAGIFLVCFMMTRVKHPGIPGSPLVYAFGLSSDHPKRRLPVGKHIFWKKKHFFVAYQKCFAFRVYRNELISGSSQKSGQRRKKNGIFQIDTKHHSTLRISVYRYLSSKSSHVGELTKVGNIEEARSR